jgi:hypothetical protein
MEEALSSETSVLTRLKRRELPENDTLRSRRCENLKSYNVYVGLCLDPRYVQASF